MDAGEGLRRRLAGRVLGGAPQQQEEAPVRGLREGQAAAPLRDGQVEGGRNVDNHANNHQCHGNSCGKKNEDKHCANDKCATCSPGTPLAPVFPAPIPRTLRVQLMDPA